MGTISILANTVRPSWQDPVHSWKAGPGEVMTVENLLFTIVQAYNRNFDLLIIFQQITN